MKELTSIDKIEITATVKRIAEALGTCRPIVAMNALMIVVRGIADIEGVDTEAAAIRAMDKQ